MRATIQSKNVIELTQWKELTLPRGLIITANCRPEQHDIVLFYVPNLVSFGCQPYFYAEYMSTLHSLMLLQGFHSPAVFIMQFPESAKHASMQANMVTMIQSWQLLAEQHPNAKLIISGDSLGGSMVLRFLLWSQGQLGPANLSAELMDISYKDIVRPFGSLLISPIVDFAPAYNACSDILQANDIKQLCCEFLPLEGESWSPCAITDLSVWNLSIPAGGAIFIYGDQEYQTKAIDALCNILGQTDRVKIVRTKHRGHCWPFISFLTEDSQDEKEDSCFLIAGMLSRMVLFSTQKYRMAGSAEPMNLLTIDDDHL